MSITRLLKLCILRSFFFFLLLVPLFSFAEGDPTSVIAKPADSNRLERLLAEAHAKNLASDPQWLKLLHYHRHAGALRSDVDGGYFFLSPLGKWDSRAELDATLRAFLSQEDLSPPLDSGMEAGRMHPLCKFRARLHFFRERLDLADSLLPKVDCDRYQRWRDALDPVGATLVFASSYLNNPASTFGHTFLRLNSRGDSAALSLLNYGITYAATVPDGDGLAFAYKGIFGSYHGTFSIVPYSLSLQKYSNLESRDVWEYDLALDSNRTEYVVEHAWELGAAWMRYFFFDENCSYNIITLLDAADPDWRLSESLAATAVMPAETVKLLERKGLLIRSRHRQSLLSAFRQKAGPMRGRSRRLLRQFMQPAPDLAGLARDTAGISPDSLSFILDVALDYVQYRKRRSEGHSGKTWAARQRELLLMRSRLPTMTTSKGDPPGAGHPGSGSPLESHATQRIGLGMGMAQYRPFLDLGYRFAYHDLNARESGFLLGSQIEVLKLDMRVDCGRDCREGVRSVGLQGADFLAIQSLTPMDDLRQPMSWGFRIGYDTRPTGSGRPGRAVIGEGGVGAAMDWETQSGLACLPFLLVQSKVRIFHAPVWEMDAGPQSRSGFRLSFGRNVSWLFENSEYLPAPFRRGLESDLRTELRYSPGRNSEVRAAVSYLDGAGEASMTLNGYF
ncbi:MAG: DUF4105 domain-containing protein [Fibrobacteria bacterium]